MAGCSRALSEGHGTEPMKLSMSGAVKVFGCRPHEGGTARTAGPASANLQGRKPREVWRGCASDAMGISLLAVYCRGALTGSVGSGRRSAERGRSIAIARTGVAQRRLIAGAVVQGGATASLVIAGREPAKQKCSTGMLPRT